MANPSRERSVSPSPQTEAPALPERPARREPEMRRWPHPINEGCGETPPQDLPAELRFIHCSLSYQNQLLAEIKTLLEGLGGK